jgi:hypothetical protein
MSEAQAYVRIETGEEEAVVTPTDRPAGFGSRAGRDRFL